MHNNKCNTCGKLLVTSTSYKGSPDFYCNCKRAEKEDSSSDILSTVATTIAVEAAMGMFDSSPSYESPSVDTSSSSDFGGFSGGDSGGGGASGSW